MSFELLRQEKLTDQFRLQNSNLKESIRDIKVAKIKRTLNNESPIISSIINTPPGGDQEFNIDARSISMVDQISNNEERDSYE